MIAEQTYVLPRNRGSVSMFGSFNRCAACFSAKYVDAVRPKLGAALVIGSAVHKAIATGRQRIMSGLPLPATDELVSVAEAGFHEACEGTYRDGTKPRPEMAPEIDFGRKIGNETTALVYVTEMTVHAVPQILDSEQALGVLHVEEEIDFEGVFPFAFTGWLDVMRGQEGTVKAIWETKTSTASRYLRASAPVQLAVLGLHWHKVGEPLLLGADLIYKNGTARPSVTTRTINPTPLQFIAAERWVLDTAAAITAAMQSGRFPVNLEAFSHDVDHGLPCVEEDAA